MKVNQEYRLRDQGERLLGIEIEMEGHRLQPEAIKYWGMKGDGSLRGEAIEYVLKQPCMLGQEEQRLQTLIDTLGKHGADLRPSERCGVHIHINCQQLWHTEVLNFVICYLILEDIMAGYCGEDRVGNLFCLRGRDAEYLIDALCHAAIRGSFRGMMTNDLRYSGLNMTSLKKFGSVEFRTLGTPKDLLSITIWIRMLLAIKQFSAQFNEPVEIVESISAGGAVEFLRHALGEDAPRVENGDAEASIMNGIRRVQDIAYLAVKEVKKEVEPPKRNIYEGLGGDVVMDAREEPVMAAPRPRGQPFHIRDEAAPIPPDFWGEMARQQVREQVEEVEVDAQPAEPRVGIREKRAARKAKRQAAAFDNARNEWVLNEVEVDQEEDR